MRYIYFRKIQKCWKTKKIYFTYNFSVPKCFSGNIEGILENSGENFWQKVENLALKVLVDYPFEKPIFIKRFLWARWLHILDNSFEKIWQKAHNNTLNISIDFKFELLFEKIIFIKLFLWTRRMHLWQYWRKILVKCQDSFVHCPQIKKYNWNFSEKKTYFRAPRTLFCKRGSPFWQPC